MQRKVDILLAEYGESHQNKLNKAVHWICVPLIMFSLLGLLYSIPFFGHRTYISNWAFVFVIFVILYYLRLSRSMFLGFTPVGLLLVYLNHELYLYLNESALALAKVSLLIFAVAWVGQFIGHHIEGKKPSFLKDVQFLLVGPAWLMHFVFERFNMKY